MVKDGSQEIVGEVVARSGLKTLRVRLDRRFRHPTLEKVIQRERDILVHDETEVHKVGDRVRLRLGRPRSRKKCFVVL